MASRINWNSKHATYFWIRAYMTKSGQICCQRNAFRYKLQFKICPDFLNSNTNMQNYNNYLHWIYFLFFIIFFAKVFELCHVFLQQSWNHHHSHHIQTFSFMELYPLFPIIFQKFSFLLLLIKSWQVELYSLLKYCTTGTYKKAPVPVFLLQLLQTKELALKTLWLLVSIYLPHWCKT